MVRRIVKRVHGSEVYLKTMIIVKLTGGLGNQLFQYAAARMLSEIKQNELKLDISSYNEDKLRRYSLGSFNIIENFASSVIDESLQISNYCK